MAAVTITQTIPTPPVLILRLQKMEVLVSELKECQDRFHQSYKGPAFRLDDWITKVCKIAQDHKTDSLEAVSIIAKGVFEEYIQIINEDAKAMVEDPQVCPFVQNVSALLKEYASSDPTTALSLEPHLDLRSLKTLTLNVLENQKKEKAQILDCVSSFMAFIKERDKHLVDEADDEIEIQKKERSEEISRNIKSYQKQIDDSKVREEKRKEAFLNYVQETEKKIAKLKGKIEDCNERITDMSKKHHDDCLMMSKQIQNEIKEREKVEERTKEQLETALKIYSQEVSDEVHNREMQEKELMQLEKALKAHSEENFRLAQEVILTNGRAEISMKSLGQLRQDMDFVASQIPSGGSCTLL